MTDTRKQASSWDDLGDLEAPFTAVLTLPDTSKRIGQAFIVRVKAIAPIELVKAYNFPLDEVNRLQESGGKDAVEAALNEHQQTLTPQEQYDAIKAVVKCGMVEPKPDDVNLDRIARDFVFIFNKIVELSKPEDAESAATFHRDGEQSGD